ncbi:MAG: hypothetical protein GY754_31515 [bacterium]|nr:hypothetical protein [bacterium]
MQIKGEDMPENKENKENKEWVKYIFYTVMCFILVLLFYLFDVEIDAGLGVFLVAAVATFGVLFINYIVDNYFD